MKKNQKLKLAAAISASVFLAACGSDSSSSSDGDKTPDVPFERTLSMAANANQSVVDLTTIKDQTCFDANQCSASGYVFPSSAIVVPGEDGDDITTALNAAVNGAGENAVIVLPKGTFTVSQKVTISATQNGLTLVGHGIDQTKLDFIDSPADDGIKVNGVNNILLRDFSVYEAPKNGIKVDQSNGVHFNYVATIWENPLTAKAEEEGYNGIYGIYPVSSFNVLVENSYSKGSSDAGIYVGQSEDIVVRYNVAEHNVAGIEIENSSNADVYENITFDNTGGLLVFDLDGLDKAFGSNVRLFNNHSYGNNLVNAGSGFVGFVPTGTGALVLASDGVEIYNNKFEDNNAQAIALAGYFLIDTEVEKYGEKYGTTILAGWTPTVNNIYMHDNTYKNNSTNPDTNPETSMLGTISAGYLSENNFTGAPVTHPAVIYDGIGELLANAGALAEMGITADKFGDTICIEDSVNENSEGTALNLGYVYGIDPTETKPGGAPLNFEEDGKTPAPTLRVEGIGSDGQTLMKCATSPERLDPSVATINGVTYGCGTGGDDTESDSCKL